MFFTVDLAKEIKNKVEFEFIKLSSYGDARVSSGKVEIQQNIAGKIEGVELSERDKLVLIQELGTEYIKLNSEYIKNCIEGRIDGLELGLFEQITLIKLLVEEYIKSVFRRTDQWNYRL